MFMGILFGTITVALYIDPDYNPLVVVLIMLPLLVFTVLFTHQITKVPDGLKIHPDRLVIGDQEIDFGSIDQYYFNDTAIGSITLELKLKTGKVAQAVMPTKTGKDAKKQFQLNYTDYCAGKQNVIGESSYIEIHSEQMKYMRPIIIALLLIVLGCDIFFLYALINQGLETPYQLLPVNAMAFAMFPYLKRNKPTNTNNTSKR
jgi:hypothetical protein